ncbi:hypothetical protein F441_15004, partial [Phytophthora nicotianae CJ01A1]
EHESKSHPVALLGRVLPDGEMNYHPVEKEVLALLLALKTCYTTLDSKRLMVYTRFLTIEWLSKSKTCPVWPHSTVRCYVVAVATGRPTSSREGRRVCTASAVNGDKLR